MKFYGLLIGLFCALLNNVMAQQECSVLPGVRATYFEIPLFTAPAPSFAIGTNPNVSPYLTQTVSNINFAWGSAGIGLPGKNNYVVVVFEGYISPPQTGDYDFIVISDDGARLIVDGNVAIDNWQAQQSTGMTSPSLYLQKYQFYPFRLEYFNKIGGNTLRFQWNSTDTGIAPGVIAGANLYSTQCSSNGTFDNCVSTPCLNGATCVDQVGTYLCTCANGWSGTRCQTAVTPTCDNNPTPPPGGNVNPPGNGTATIIGDPHVDTWDGNVYSFAGVGYYTSMISLDGNSILQTYFDRCAVGKVATCVFKVAFRFNGATAIFVFGQTPQLYNAAGILKVTTSNGVLILSATNGPTIRLGVSSYQTYNMRIDVPTYYFTQVRGLLGTFDSNANNDYTDVNGNVVSFDEFITSWYISPTSTDNIYMNPSAVPNALVRSFQVNCVPPTPPPGGNNFPTPTPTGSNGGCPVVQLYSSSYNAATGRTTICYDHDLTAQSAVCSGNYTQPSTCPNCS